ncbi:MAG: helicase-related protein, partial [Thermoanaerobaculia bacterium]|nr:helicase-related protein [Thermoanaerobaculia bacterium]
IIDEQHRFGVEQRRRMVEKGDRPDLLVMTATPIPRSLALTAYGDLETAILDELPPGRKPVESLILPAEDRARAYRRLRTDLEAGGQGYVVFPAIDEPGELEIPSLEREGTVILETLSDHEGAVLHGRLPLEDRERIMECFRRGEIRFLLATSVIEVGVDVPAATAMIIEGAERFGLAQLHQLRGRVGRGKRPAWCAAIHGSLTEAGRERMRAFHRHRDGFALAERDLEIRGPGELLGERQAGEAGFRFADLRRHMELLEAARQDARDLVAAGRIPPEVLP